MPERVIRPGRRRGRVEIPSSKSIAHRELIAAALSGVAEPIIRGESRDVAATRRCLKALLGGEHLWPCGESGTTRRLLEPIAGVMGLSGSFVCEGRLAERPQMPFVRQSRYVIAGNVSSQFVSGLLMALPLASWDSEIVIDGPLQSEPYVVLTEDVLAAAGIRVERQDGPSLSWRIRGGQRYHIAGGRPVEGDWSQAAFFLAMGNVEVDGLRPDSHQGDRVVTDLIAQINQRVSSVDLSNTPDLYPVLAAYAASIGSPTAFTGTERLRLKESDRLASTEAMIDAVREGRVVHTCNDHRIAMSAAVMAVYAKEPVTIDDDACVAKSFPDFWECFDALACDPLEKSLP